MQSQHIKLNEIIWEITGECHNGCSYCGSKEVCKLKTSPETILKIAEAIAQYPPEQIDISGGDPILIEYSVHKQVVDILKEKKVICKIIVSPNSLIINNEPNDNAFMVMQFYDWIGISVNNKKELEKFQSYQLSCAGINKIKNYTVITNFNIQNLYDFDLIEEFVKQNDKIWTIQFTVYNDPSNPLALYHPDNEAAFNTLKEKVEKSTAKIILSDNIRNDIGCGAGINSIGITSDGTVIPCLSMRSWTSPLKEKGLFNILSTPLEKIWINGFKAQRFGCFKCCKDACNNKFLTQKSDFEKKMFELATPTIENKEMDWKKFLEDLQKQTPPQPPFSPMEQTVMYAVQFPRQQQTLMYAVPCGRGNVYAYAVFMDRTVYDNSIPLDSSTNISSTTEPEIK